MAGVAEVDVLVVGAGPTGLMTAVELARRGVGVRIVERAAVPSDKPRAIAVQARSLEMLQKVGCAEELAARGRHITALRGYVDGDPVIDAEFGDVPHTPYPFLLLVSQSEMERSLRARLQELGGEVERGAELVGLADDGRVEARLAHDGCGQETVRARWLVGCDGAHSAARKLTGLRFDGDRYPQDFVLADAALDWENPPDRIYFFLSRTGVVALFPMLEGWRVLAACAGGIPGEGDPTVEEVQAVASALCPFPLRIHDPFWLARFRLHRRAVDHYRRGHVLVAGDAAHIHSPTGGQGMNTGIQDAENLAWKLALVLQGRAPERLLDSYEEERMPVGREVLRVSDWVLSYASGPRHPWLLGARNVLLRLLAPLYFGSEEGHTRPFRFMSELGVHYGASSVVAEGRDARGHTLDGGPAAGHRAMDGPLVLARDGTEASLFSRITGPNHHLLAFAPPGSVDSRALAGRLAEALGARAAWIDVHVVTDGKPTIDGTAGERVYTDATGTVRRRYGVDAGALYLVRPDGYVGFRVPDVSAAPLQGYLADCYA
jgi:2-polyprenyl-6-methoxyphenol hydroxylase-like FAD-dependent oxidoreductase